MNRKALINKFKEKYLTDPEFYVCSHGRVEMIGNHTDHNHGLCAAFTCNLAIEGYVKVRNDMCINVESIGFGVTQIDLNDLAIHKDEAASTKGLIRGIARYFKEHGMQTGGFDLLIQSTIFPGAGVSSSAAFETLIGQIFSYLFNDGKVDRLVIAKAGQYAENTDFGKNSGLLDQIGTGYGNISFIDFEDIANPKVEVLKFPFKDLRFVIVNTGGSHAELTHLYAAIPSDMKSAAKKMGVNFLREASIEKMEGIDFNDMEKNRAIHFFCENERVLSFKHAIENKNEEKYLEAINGSRKSSTNYLKNMMVEGQYNGSPLEATDIASKMIGKDGACRINGGGFAGSIICTVKKDKLEEFIVGMKSLYGNKNVKEVKVAKKGFLIKKVN